MNEINVVESFEKQLRKGFLNILILYFLNEKPSYGYKIIKDMIEYTEGVWKPHTSSIYPNLRSLEEKGLIEFTKEIATGNRKSKEYKITIRGRDVFLASAGKLKEVVGTMRSMLISLFGIDVNYTLEDFINVIPFDTLWGWELEIPKEKKISNLSEILELLTERMLYLEEYKEFIKKRIYEIDLE